MLQNELGARAQFQPSTPDWIHSFFSLPARSFWSWVEGARRRAGGMFGLQAGFVSGGGKTCSGTLEFSCAPSRLAASSAA